MTAPSTGPIKVLIVDDHPVVRRGLRVLLEVQDGIEVAGEAGDGATALALAAELSPDVVLLDLKLPGMDGIAVLTAAQSQRQQGPGARAHQRDRTRLGQPGAALGRGRGGVQGRGPGRAGPGDPLGARRAPAARAGGGRLAGPQRRRLEPGGRPGRAHRPGARGARRDRQGPVQPGDRPGADRLGEDGEGARECGAGQARRAGPHPGRPDRGAGTSAASSRPGARRR